MMRETQDPTAPQMAVDVTAKKHRFTLSFSSPPERDAFLKIWVSGINASAVSSSLYEQYYCLDCAQALKLAEAMQDDSHAIPAEGVIAPEHSDHLDGVPPITPQREVPGPREEEVDTPALPCIGLQPGASPPTVQPSAANAKYSVTVEQCLASSTTLPTCQTLNEPTTVSSAVTCNLPTAPMNPSAGSVQVTCSDVASSRAMDITHAEDGACSSKPQLAASSNEIHISNVDTECNASCGVVLMPTLQGVANPEDDHISIQPPPGEIHTIDVADLPLTEAACAPCSGIGWHEGWRQATASEVQGPVTRCLASICQCTGK